MAAGEAPRPDRVEQAFGTVVFEKDRKASVTGLDDRAQPKPREPLIA